MARRSEGSFSYLQLCPCKTFESLYKDTLAKSKSPSCQFSRKYPFHKPSLPEQGGWDRVFNNLSMYVGVGFDPNGNNGMLYTQRGWCIRLVRCGIEEVRRSQYCRRHWYQIKTDDDGVLYVWILVLSNAWRRGHSRLRSVQPIHRTIDQPSTTMNIF